ncbi:MAG: hypothetical protein FWG44_06525 [Oscillospiraceae bacterium]|nr:hypothetical protein [Oscillospiraceae bacterium]
MTFRDAYKNEFNLICTNEKLIENILYKMRKEVNAPTPFIKRIPTARLATAAAGICILIAAAVVIPSVMKKDVNFTNDGFTESNYVGETIPENPTTSGSGESETFEKSKESDVDEDSAEIIENEAAYNTADSMPVAPGAVPSPPSENATTGGTMNGMEAENDVLAETSDNLGDDSVSYSNDYDRGATNWSGFLNFGNYASWPNSNLWDNLEVHAPLPHANSVADEKEIISEPEIMAPPFNIDSAEIAEENEIYEEETIAAADGIEEIYDMPEPRAPLPELNTFGEFAGMFLTEEHRLSSAYYGIEQIYGETVMFMYASLSFRDVDAAPVYAMLSKYLSRETISSNPDSEIRLNGVIRLEICTNESTIFIMVTEDDKLILMSANYNGSCSIQLDNGEYQKLFNYLEQYNG